MLPICMQSACTHALSCFLQSLMAASITFCCRLFQTSMRLDLGAAQSSIFGSARNFLSARSAGSSRKLRLNSNHAPKVNARPYWAYNRPITPMYEHLWFHLRRGLIICCVCVCVCVVMCRQPTETSNETIQQPVMWSGVVTHKWD